MTAVLFTCAGQRVDIVSAFDRAGAITVATDADRLAPALYHAHHMALVPRIDDAGYVPALAALVREHDVRLVIPLTDLDQGLLSRSRDALAPALVLVPEPAVCDAMGDKWLAHVFFEEHGIPSPRSWLPGDVPATRAIRCSSRCARASARATSIARTMPSSSSSSSARRPSTRSCRSCCRGEEFSIDVFCDLGGRCLNAIPRTMIQSKGGESIKGRSIRDRELIEHGRTVAETIGIRRPGEHPVLPRARRLAPRHGRQPTLRRCVPAAARGRRPLPGARPRARARREPRAAARRVS